MSIDLQAAIESGEAAVKREADTNKTVSELMRLPAAELDSVISRLLQARKVRAAYEALYKFKAGDQVQWETSTNKGMRLVRGEYAGPEGNAQNGNILITKVRPVTPEPGLDVNAGASYVVDALQVELAPEK